MNSSIIRTMNEPERIRPAYEAVLGAAKERPLAYKAANAARRLYWELAHPATWGAGVVPYDPETRKVALILQTYGPYKRRGNLFARLETWHLAGGGLSSAAVQAIVASGVLPEELFRDDALREYKDVMGVGGVSVEPDGLVPLVLIKSGRRGNHDTFQVYGHSVDSSAITFDPKLAEVAKVDWFPLDNPGVRVSYYVQEAIAMIRQNLAA